ncbi:TonB-dependent receptor domain-containing protein [Novosphingobium cyanobacteriorum]|uniref:TonB-dependent receptor n=1 Tax=Novosphingobium cyanobacteriorum TaxID=3024215 RepID=A0ABT6CGI5_9SPHN|nr:TonB-dependent receptor [Novosphingobium cyanobacteriorum]MDF8333036.1 TonB-dependent receptor [Novosphingobium cyanobacteriorum]
MKIFSMLKTGAAPAALGVALLAGPAFAQEAAPQAGAAASGDEVIVVTGSRIARPDLTSTSPLNVVGASDIALKGGSANIENVLNDLPQVTPTTSGASNNPGGGVATVNLRNLGDQRTLVLVDGRRYMSYDVNQVVDLNTIPSALIERVDVVTGGQSAVYGSDAIAGVVNFSLKRNFSGITVNSSYDLTGRGDGAIFDINGVVGGNFEDGRGNATMFVGYTERKAVFAAARGFAKNALVDNGDGTFSFGGSGSVPQGRINLPGIGAATGLGCDIQDFAGGVNSCYDSTADAYNYAPINYLQVPQKRFVVAGMAHYEINDNFKPYIEAQFVNNRVSALLAPTPISNGTPYGDGVIGKINLFVNSPFFTPEFRTALGTLDTDGDGYVQSNFNYRTTQLGGRLNKDDRSAYRFVVGMKGDIGAGFSYDGYYMYARTKNTQRQQGNVAIDRFLAATTNAVVGGQLVCADPTARAAGCAPANIFGANNLSPEAVKYLGVSATNIETYNTQVASFAVTNPNLFDLGAGGVGLALGAEYRKESGSVEPDTYLASGNVAGFNPGQATGGSYNVKEFFGELRVPILRDSFIHRLDLNGAARYSKYSNAPGDVFTWSAGLELAPTPDITFRGQYQKAVRGPSVNELYLGNTVSFNGNADKCGTAAALSGTLNQICTAQFNAAGAPTSLIGNPIIQDPNIVNPLTFIGGNSGLREETAKTYTLGAVLTPTFLPGFTATVDYYNIKIDNYITAGVGTDAIGTLCFDRFNQAYCDVIARNSVGEIDTFRDGYVNSGGLKTSGVDISMNYRTDIGTLMGSPAKVSLSFDGTRLIRNDFTPVVGLDLVYKCAGSFGANCGVPTPKWRHMATTGLSVGPFDAQFSWRYIGSAYDDDPNSDYASENFDAVSYFDLALAFEVNEHFTLRGGVTNLFDKEPPLAASTQNGGNGEQTNTFPTLYDVLGRRFFMSATMHF